MNPGERLKQWRATEMGGDAARSEVLLSALMRSLPDYAPSPALMDRVLAEAGLLPRPGRSRLAVWVSRVVLVAAVLLVALSLPVAPQLASWILPSAGDLVAVLSTVFTWGAGIVSLAVSLWSFFARVATLVSLVLATPQGLAAIGLTLGVGWLSFRWLERLTSLHRSASHADLA